MTMSFNIFFLSFFIAKNLLSPCKCCIEETFGTIKAEEVMFPGHKRQTEGHKQI